VSDKNAIPMDSKGRFLYGVQCVNHGHVPLTYEEYIRQLSFPDSLWKCPLCMQSGMFDGAIEDGDEDA